LPSSDRNGRRPENGKIEATEPFRRRAHLVEIQVGNADFGRRPARRIKPGLAQNSAFGRARREIPRFKIQLAATHRLDQLAADQLATGIVVIEVERNRAALQAGADTVGPAGLHRKHLRNADAQRRIGIKEAQFDPTVALDRINARRRAVRREVETPGA